MAGIMRPYAMDPEAREPEAREPGGWRSAGIMGEEGRG